MHSQEFIERMKERLIEERERINEELSQLHSHVYLGEGETDSVDYDDNMQEVPIDEVNQDIIFQLKGDLEKIDKALAKIENGTYGITESGQEISEARLEVLPWADSLA